MSAISMTLDCIAAKCRSTSLDAVAECDIAAMRVV